jgi:uncharacterized protein YjbI with pentapeptide repeats
LFVFLLENGLLLDATKRESTVDLTDADLSSVTVECPSRDYYRSSWLSLLSVNLMNATFIYCVFHGPTDFSDSTLANAHFVRSAFVVKLQASSVDFTNASFLGCSFSGETYC